MPLILQINRSEESSFRLIIIILMVLGVAFLTSDCSGTKKEIPDEFRVLSVKELYPRALEEAEKWKDDAYLNIVGLWVTPKDYSNVLHVYFGFESKDSPEWLNIKLVETDSGINIKSKDSGVYPSDLRKPEIYFDKVILDSTDAFRQIYHREGKEIFKRHPDMIYPITFYLHRHGDKSVKWVASFESKDGVSWRITMDAETNEILEVSNWVDE